MDTLWADLSRRLFIYGSVGVVVSVCFYGFTFTTHSHNKSRSWVSFTFKINSKVILNTIIITEYYKNNTLKLTPESYDRVLTQYTIIADVPDFAWKIKLKKLISFE